MDQNEAATVQDLCTVARRQMVFFELCPSDDWSSDAFNEKSTTLSENLVSALTKLTQKQDEIKQHQTEMSNRINTFSSKHVCNQNYNNDNNQNRNFNYRGNNRYNNEEEYIPREDIEEEETSIEETTEEEVDMPTTEGTMATTTITEVTKTTMVTTTNSYNSHLMMDISKRPVTRKMYVTTVDTQITTPKIVFNVNQHIETSKFRIKQHQKTSRATPV